MVEVTSGKPVLRGSRHVLPRSGCQSSGSRTRLGSVLVPQRRRAAATTAVVVECQRWSAGGGL